MNQWHFRLWPIAVLTLASCGGPAPTEPAADPQPTSPQPPAATTLAAAPITAQVQSIAQLEERIASHKGKVVVVDLWALW